METLDPYLFFRFFLALLFAGLLIHDVIGLIVWYRGLPRWIRRIVILKILQIRSGRIKWEAGGIVVLLGLEGWLLTLLLKGFN